MPGVGIDITTRQTIAVELSRVGAQYRVGRCAVLSGYTHEPEKPAASARTSALAESVHQAPSGLRRGGAISLPGKDVIFRLTEVGSSDPGAVGALVRMEVSELTGGGSPMLPAYQIVMPPDGASMALIGVAREELIEHFGGSLAAAGLHAGCFVPAPIALYHCYLVSGPVDTDGLQMVFNIGENQTDVIVVSGSDLLAARTIPMGVETMVSGLSRSLGVNAEQGRETLFKRIDMRPGIAGPNVSGERAVAAAQDAAAQLFMQLNGTIAYARGQLSMPKLEIARFVMCGSGAGVKGLSEFLQSRFRKPVQLLNTLSGFDTTGLDDESLKQIGQYAPALAVPLGLAVISADQDSGDLKFIPPSIVARSRFLRRTVWLYAGMILIVAGLAASLFLAVAALDASAKTKADVNNMAARQSDARRAAVRRSIPTDGNIKATLEAISEIDREEVDVTQRLVEVAESRRPGLYSSELLFHLLKTLHPQVTMTAFSQEPVMQGDGTEIAGVKVSVFIESGEKQPPELYTALQASVKGHRSVSSLTALPLEPVGGKGSTGTLIVVLADTGALIKELGEVK
jgi:Tfp pilus assembly PilM family ATPase/Tfp pilus assembly protein PilN